MLAGERLPKQRPHGEHPDERVPHQDEEAGSIKEVRVITSAAAKENEEFLDKDAEILRLIEDRRSTPKEEKQRLKDLSKLIKKCIREKKESRDSKTSKESLKSSKAFEISRGSKQQRRKYSSQK